MGTLDKVSVSDREPQGCRTVPNGIVSRLCIMFAELKGQLA